MSQLEDLFEASPCDDNSSLPSTLSNVHFSTKKGLAPCHLCNKEHMCFRAGDARSHYHDPTALCCRKICRRVESSLEMLQLIEDELPLGTNVNADNTPEFFDYVIDKFQLVRDLPKIGTRASMEAALEHALDQRSPWLDYNQARPEVSALVALLYLRLGREQDAWDFICRNGSHGISSGGLDFRPSGVDISESFPPSSASGSRSSRSWAAALMFPGFTPFPHGDPPSCSARYRIAHLANAVLVKFRVMRDLKALMAVTEDVRNPGCRFVGAFPPELSEQICREAMVTDIAKRKDIQQAPDLKSLYHKLDRQCAEMIAEVHNSPSHDNVWPTLAEDVGWRLKWRVGPRRRRAFDPESAAAIETCIPGWHDDRASQRMLQRKLVQADIPWRSVPRKAKPPVRIEPTDLLDDTDAAGFPVRRKRRNLGRWNDATANGNIGRTDRDS